MLPKITCTNLEILLPDVPVCKNSDPVVHGVGKGEMVEVLCDVVANPNVDNFQWAFNNSAGLIHVPPSRAKTFNGTRSKLTYTPKNNKDYGTLMCEAKNEVGKQKQPCIFHIILAGEINDYVFCFTSKFCLFVKVTKIRSMFLFTLFRRKGNVNFQAMFF